MWFSFRGTSVTVGGIHSEDGSKGEWLLWGKLWVLTISPPFFSCIKLPFVLFLDLGSDTAKCLNMPSLEALLPHEEPESLGIHAEIVTLSSGSGVLMKLIAAYKTHITLQARGVFFCFLFFINLVIGKGVTPA